MHRLSGHGLFALLLAVAALGCGGNDTTAPTDPGGPDQIVVETFNGTLTVNGAQTHLFQATTRGSILAVLGDVSPDGAIVGFQMGTANGGLCTAVQSHDDAAEGTRIILAASAAGSICIRIYDTGTLTAPIDYSIYVEHP